MSVSEGLPAPTGTEAGAENRTATMCALATYLILILLTSLSITGAHADESADRELMIEAFRTYEELFDQQDFEASLVEARRVLDLAEELLPDDDKQLAAARVNYGTNLTRLGRVEEARTILASALQQFEEIYGKNSVELVSPLLSMAEASVEPPAYAPPRHYIDRAYEIVKMNFDPSSMEYADAMFVIAQNTSFYPAPVTTGETLDEVLGIYRSQEEPSAIHIGNTLRWLGYYHMSRGEYTESERFFLESLGVLENQGEEAQRFYDDVDEVLIKLRTDLDARKEEIASLAIAHEEFKSDESFDRSLPIIRVAPVYPEAALKEGSTGYVDIRFTVDEQGFPINPLIVKSSGHRSFRGAALGALARFRYVPLYTDGEATAVQGVQTRIAFEIQN